MKGPSGLSSNCENMKSTIIRIIFLAGLFGYPLPIKAFGFQAHRIINRQAVYALPPELLGNFKPHVEELSARAVEPDKRAHSVPGEAQRHYIDLDIFPEWSASQYPRERSLAEKLLGDSVVKSNGVLPWHIHRMSHRLTRAFKQADKSEIIRLAAHLGHYVADACTPLHTTMHYNGRLEHQRGIHALWETRLIELFSASYRYWVAPAAYMPCTLEAAWQLVLESHDLVDSIYAAYDQVYEEKGAHKIYVHDSRGAAHMRTYSPEFCKAFHKALNGMTAQQMRRAIQAVRDFWYTAWVNAGQPDF